VTNRIDAGRIRPCGAGAQPAPTAEARPPSERALRSAASDRLDAFVAGRPVAAATGTGDFECPNDDFDRCVDRTVPNPRLWIEQGSDSDAIDKADVRQSQLGDCYVLAVLAGLTNTAEGRALLRSAITEKTTPGGQVLTYGVTLHEPHRHWFASTTFTARQVDVPPIFARGHAQARPGSGGTEVWVPVMERAYAQLAGGYNAMGHGGRIADAMEIITGQPARSYGLGPIFGRYRPQDLQRDLLSGHVVAVASRTDVEQSRPDLVPNHAYLVTGLESYRSKPALRLWNPWGSVQPAPVPFDELRSLFTQLDVGSPK
jgi:calpain family cysteine protease